MSMLIPPSLLRKVYLTGSLVNGPQGFSFTLKNTIARGTLQGLTALAIDGEEVPVGQVKLEREGEVTPADAITPAAPWVFPVNTPVQVTIAGKDLSPGEHTLKVGLTLKELGSIVLEVRDTLVGE